jgi:hypothetical protein
MHLTGVPALVRALVLRRKKMYPCCPIYCISNTILQAECSTHVHARDFMLWVCPSGRFAGARRRCRSNMCEALSSDLTHSPALAQNNISPAVRLLVAARIKRHPDFCLAAVIASSGRRLVWRLVNLRSVGGRTIQKRRVQLIKVDGLVARHEGLLIPSHNGSPGLAAQVARDSSEYGYERFFLGWQSQCNWMYAERFRLSTVNENVGLQLLDRQEDAVDVGARVRCEGAARPEGHEKGDRAKLRIETSATGDLSSTGRGAYGEHVFREL